MRPASETMQELFVSQPQTLSHQPATAAHETTQMAPNGPIQLQPSTNHIMTPLFAAKRG